MLLVKIFDGTTQCFLFRKIFNPWHTDLKWQTVWQIFELQVELSFFYWKNYLIMSINKAEIKLFLFILFVCIHKAAYKYQIR